jgi:hypothetical protein
MRLSATVMYTTETACRSVSVALKEESLLMRLLFPAP